MSRVVHIAIKVLDLEAATKFYTEVFGFKETKTGRSRGHISRHLTDGHIDIALMVYDDENPDEAQLAGPGPRIHHWGISVDDQDAAAEKIRAYGGEVFPHLGKGALKFRAPDGTLAEVVLEDRYATKA
ncbi:MAG: VOC family protein [Rhodospirillaceae bacterium]|nr:VOC family protein [Rhodospirillaceae bacterium]